MSENPSVAVLEQPTSSSERPENPSCPASMATRILVAGGDPVPGAFNDNPTKISSSSSSSAQVWRRPIAIGSFFVAGALFSVPFILFSMTGGFLADRYSKRTVTIGTKFFEIGVMVLALAGLAWQNLHLEMAAIFLASTQAAFFGPSKYGLAARATARAETFLGQRRYRTGTFLAAIAGLVSGAFLADAFMGARAGQASSFSPVSGRIDLQSRDYEGSVPPILRRSFKPIRSAIFGSRYA